jgi:signal transduction histidine kinase
VSFHAAKTPVKVLFQSHYDGALCESCLEFSTLDRIIYNLMNNAAEHSDDGVVHFYLVPLPGDPPVDVRLVFRNQVNEEQQRQLREQFGDDPSEIFRGGFTTGGHGLGMRICADFCAQAYGLSDFQRAKDKGYFGAKWIGDQFTTWFHWPIGNGSIL